MDLRRQHDLLRHLQFWMLGEGQHRGDQAMLSAYRKNPLSWSDVEVDAAVRSLRMGALRDEAPQAEIDELIEWITA